ncbi:MAG: hypothetical protein ABH830_04420 [Patescibacteria group bacterium]
MENYNLNFLRLRKITSIILIVCLIAIFILGFDPIISKARDVKRKADLKNLTVALNLYYDKYGFYPSSDNDWRDWDLTYEFKGAELNFLKILVDENFINKMVIDPLNTSNFYYRYQKYPARSLGCEKAFYILQLTSFELPTSDIGAGACPGMDWTEIAPNGYTIQAFD